MGIAEQAGARPFIGGQLVTPPLANELANRSPLANKVANTLANATYRFRDPDKRRAYMRDYMRAKRQGKGKA